jgi:Tol biopolymer transport system component
VLRASNIVSSKPSMTRSRFKLSRTRVTFGTTGALFPFTWSADGSSILFSRVDDRKEGLDIVAVPADGSTPPKLLAAGEQRQWATSVAMNGLA